MKPQGIYMNPPIFSVYSTFGYSEVRKNFSQFQIMCVYYIYTKTEAQCVMRY